MAEATVVDPFDQLSIMFPVSDNTADSIWNYLADEYNVPHFSATIWSDAFTRYPFDHHLHQSAYHDSEDMEAFRTTQMENIKRWLEEDDEQSLMSSVHHDHYHDLSDLDQPDDNERKFDEPMISTEAASVELTTSSDDDDDEQVLILPTKEMEIDKHLSVKHLTRAFVEAMENEETELAEVICRRIAEKVSPVGEIEERLVYYWFQEITEKERDHLKQESNKNFGQALETFYQVFPYGMFSHSAANSVIMESMPCDTEVLHIVDFDMGEGVQWCSLTATLAHQYQQLKKIRLRITTIKWKAEEQKWKFEETKRRLCSYAKEVGLNLRVDEMEVEEMVKGLKKGGGGRREWLGFNCMWGIPHMGRRRRRRDVREFMIRAKEILGWRRKMKSGGIICYGDGETGIINWGERIDFNSFHKRHMNHYKALLESMEWGFFPHLSEARVAMEALFVAPFLSWRQLWEEIKEEESGFECALGLEGRRLKEEGLIEAKEMVQRDDEGNSPYTVRIQEHQIVLEWRRTPLITISTWQ